VGIIIAKAVLHVFWKKAFQRVRVAGLKYAVITSDIWKV
jgi:hypothetical protein